MDENKNSALIVFEDKNIRRTWFNDEWYFSLVDVTEALTDSLRNSEVFFKHIKQLC